MVYRPCSGFPIYYFFFLDFFLIAVVTLDQSHSLMVKVILWGVAMVWSSLAREDFTAL